MISAMTMMLRLSTRCRFITGMPMPPPISYGWPSRRGDISSRPCPLTMRRQWHAFYRRFALSMAISRVIIFFRSAVADGFRAAMGIKLRH